MRYKTELLRLIAQMGLGTGALAVIGGTVVVVAFLTMTTGALSAVIGYNQLADIGVEAFTGFASAYFNVRLAAPLTSGIALAATIGAGATAQLGAMRINEEIDALEVMGVRAIAFLASSRVLAGVIVVIPLYCVAVLAAFLSTRVLTTIAYGQSVGVYDHYFRTFLYPVDLVWSFVLALSMAILIMLVHTYYGFNASGGPAGVGEAVGRAVRTSLVSSAVLTVFLSLALYGQAVVSACRVRAQRMESISPQRRITPGWWTAILVVVVVAFVWLCSALFAGTLTPYVPVTLTSERSGLVMESGAKVQLRGVEVGRVAGVTAGPAGARLTLHLSPDQIKYIPSNVEAQIRATTIFGAKYVDLIYPSQPAGQHISVGAVLVSRNVSTEVNTVFENLRPSSAPNRSAEAQRRADRDR